MPHTLRHQDLVLQMDLPGEHYQGSRFDWSGKITGLLHKGCELAGFESLAPQDVHVLGRGFYNEFGIDTALGFGEAAVGEWFHKIGVGLLQKDSGAYSFARAYKIRPADFSVETTIDSIQLTCRSEHVLGYAYVLEKIVRLEQDGFSISYRLDNLGEKEIRTDEYVHNFLAIDQARIGVDYVLKFPFNTKPEAFGETVNPEGKVEVQGPAIRFSGTPTEPFFFSNLSGGETLATTWELQHLNKGVGIRELVDFPCAKANLWGCEHVISPELFCAIQVPAGASANWTRRYQVFEI